MKTKYLIDNLIKENDRNDGEWLADKILLPKKEISIINCIDILTKFVNDNLLKKVNMTILRNRDDNYYDTKSSIFCDYTNKITEIEVLKYLKKKYKVKNLSLIVKQGQGQTFISNGAFYTDSIDILLGFDRTVYPKEMFNDIENKIKNDYRPFLKGYTYIKKLHKNSLDDIISFNKTIISNVGFNPYPIPSSKYRILGVSCLEVKYTQKLLKYFKK